MKKHDFGDDLGAKYCWAGMILLNCGAICFLSNFESVAGTFGALTHNTGNYDELEGSRNVTVNLGCPLNNLFYRQCIIPLQMAIILIVRMNTAAVGFRLRPRPDLSSLILQAVGGFVFLCGTTCICFVCGCCKCCNRPGGKVPEQREACVDCTVKYADESKWGMCNRFCPWMPCADPQKKDDAPASWQHNPVTEEENKSSLFGGLPKVYSWGVLVDCLIAAGRNPAFKPSGSETGIAMTAQKAPLAGSKV